MPGLFDVCIELFNTKNLYEVLGVTKDATNAKLKKGYHKLSLQVHPDRVLEAEKEDATKKFQTLGRVYSVLCDKDKRAIYDESGEVDEENDIAPDRDWYEYWRILFSKISVKDIQEYEQKYKGSEEELDDLKSAYMEFEGDMDDVMDSVLCANVEDEDRFVKILKNLIKKGDLPDYEAFSKESKTKKSQRKRKAKKEEAEADEYKKELGLDENASLKALILQKKESREKAADNFFAQLEEKYAKPKKTKGKKAK